MKVWYQYGTEHSANLVMIGHFEDVTEAPRVKEIIDQLTNQVAQDQSNGTLTIGSPTDRYSTEMLDLLGRLNLSIGPQEVEQFAYDVSVKVEGNNVVLTTEELDISAFLKVMFLKGARIEVYSAHDFPESAHGRGR
ncbi:DUF6375 family protein [Acidocella sp.]|uniref:DUF6375 family protein n=1 Tax=Acidocella sp. TaxID=50710 RepID=UPI003D006764